MLPLQGHASSPTRTVASMKLGYLALMISLAALVAAVLSTRPGSSERNPRSGWYVLGASVLVIVSIVILLAV